MSMRIEGEKNNQNVQTAHAREGDNLSLSNSYH